MNDYMTITVNKKFLAALIGLVVLYKGGCWLYGYAFNKGADAAMQYVIEQLKTRGTPYVDRSI